MTTRTCEPRAGVTLRHALGVTSQSPAGNTCETTELPGKCCLAPTASSKPQKAGTLPSPTPVGACPAGCLSHMCAHSHTCMHVHTLAWDSGAERTQEGPTASPTPPCSPACPTDRRPRPHPWRMCLWQMPRPLGRTAPQSQCEPLRPCS